MPFNKILNQLEAVYEINTHELPYESHEVVLSYINTIFENSDLYNIGSLDKTWFNRYKETNPIKATNFIYNILTENGKVISKQCILESIHKQAIQ